jgi:endonuclease I
MIKLLSIYAVLAVVLCPPFTNACVKSNPPPVDLNSYYASANGLTGDGLKGALNTIINDHTAFDYSPCVWEILKEADQDPDNTNNVIGIYTRRSIPKSDQDSGGNTPDYWNREHLWPNSKGFRSRDQHAYRDAHHLRASDKSVNDDRANNDFANGGIADTECTECKEGNGTWEAPDVVKGDIARAMFYMVVRYEGNDTSGVPDLELVDRLTTTGEARMGQLCELVDWHLNDPVSAEEQLRNEIVYSWQANRNPFIDHPEYVLSVWGPECGIQPVVEDEDVPTLPEWGVILLGTMLLIVVFRTRQQA